MPLAPSKKCYAAEYGKACTSRRNIPWLLHTLEKEQIDLAAELSEHRIRGMFNISEARFTFFLSQIWENECRIAFWVNGPFEHFCAYFLQSAPTDFTFPVMIKSFHHGARRDRMACALCSILSAHDVCEITDDQFKDACKLVTLLLLNDESRPLMYDRSLMRRISLRETDTSLASILEIFQSAKITDFSSAYLIGEKCIALAFRSGFHPQIAVLEFVQLLSKDKAWTSHLCTCFTLSFMSSWPLFLAKVVENLLCNSFELLIKLARANTLDTFTTFVSKYESYDAFSPEWKCVYTAFLKLWPEQVWRSEGASLATAAPAAVRAVSSLCCPITLQPFNCPVVASDGHTYERDAILTHMATSTLSPLTNGELSTDLVVNYAVFENSCSSPK